MEKPVIFAQPKSKKATGKTKKKNANAGKKTTTKKLVMKGISEDEKMPIEDQL